MKIVINNCYGGFSLSIKGTKEYYKRKGQEVYFYEQTKHEYKDGEDLYIKIKGDDVQSFSAYGCFHDLGDVCDKITEDYVDMRPDDRSDPDLVYVVEKLGEKANGDCAELKIVEIPDGVDWEIEEYDGSEWVAEKHRTWQ